MNICNSSNVKKITASLLEIEAIKLSPQKPYVWASGWKSPIYCDNRLILSAPRLRNFIKQSMIDFIQKRPEQPDVIAGVATGGIPIGAMLADELNLPFVYVRSKAKVHGMGNKIEGKLLVNQKVLVIEDLISTGGSVLQAVNAIREAGANPSYILAVFTYAFEEAKKNMARESIDLYTLSDYNYLIQYIEENKIYDSETLKKITRWRKDPSLWGEEL